MSVWPNNSVAPSLQSSEGALISVSVSVEPRLLEDLLEALAQIEFPINPQIYHDAALRYVYADGREEVAPTTLVDFPAYADRLPEIRRMLQLYGFAPDSLHATAMLDEIQSDGEEIRIATGETYPKVFRLKHAHAGTVH